MFLPLSHLGQLRKALRRRDFVAALRSVQVMVLKLGLTREGFGSM